MDVATVDIPVHLHLITATIGGAVIIGMSAPPLLTGQIVVHGMQVALMIMTRVGTRLHILQDTDEGIQEMIDLQTGKIYCSI